MCVFVDGFVVPLSLNMPGSALLWWWWWWGGLGVRLLRGAVGELLELVLVDLSDDGLVRGRQHRVLLGEVLVEIIHVSLRFLQKQTQTGRDEVRKVT